MFDQMPLMVIAMSGPDLRVVAATGAYRAYAGRTQMIGVPIREVFPESLGQQIWEIYDQVYATGEPASLREFRAQIDRPDLGQTVEIFVDFNVNPVLGPDGAVTGLVVDLADATSRVRERQAAAAAVEQAERRYAAARDVIHAMQRELLPAGVPVLPQVQVAASYLLADADTAAGGDWFDALALPDGRTALIVGDVVGHGLAASATMGQLRVLLSERLAATGDIVAAIGEVDRLAARTRGGYAATVCVVILDPATGEVCYCTAGHPPPLFIPRRGEARYLPPTGDGPLGVSTDRVTIGGAAAPRAVEVRVADDRLEVGDMLLLYTDGILERPGRTLAQSTVELARAAADAAAGRALPLHEPTAAERVCQQSLEMLVRVTGHNDDITLLAAQRTEPAAPFHTRVSADTRALNELRQQIAGWLTPLAVTDADLSAIQHGVTELATNALDHAYLDEPYPGPITVDATLTASGHLHLDVRDRGRWREPKPSADRGLGLTMASRFVDALRITPIADGTVATIEHPLSRPARLLTAEELASGVRPPQPEPANPFLILDQPSAPTPRIRIDGPIDAHTAPQVDDAIRTASATGTRDLTVDLTGVTHLASAGVSVLHQLTARSNANGRRLRLYAPPGSPADIVTTLVDLPHHTSDPDTTTGSPAHDADR
ncbi:SpoIIE family protein phosphatase [Catenuloplanes atrovinosus]|uniref:SpoIIE family protein phosphatase n=1 Tax=Catenuloplanes atrovinosus TaxID=137266 RepID=UPI00286ADD20|nr:SpoIIE family protein phosphatase [Catenuloplanes atrovinosus]